MSSEIVVEVPIAKVYTCGYNCICTKKECALPHHIKSYEDRKFAANIYGFIPDIRDHIKEDNVETRKVNCFKGQLCQNKECGFRHFLDPEGRQQFAMAMSVANFAKNKKTPLTDDEKSFKIAEMQEKIMALEAKMETVLAALASK